MKKSLKVIFSILVAIFAKENTKKVIVVIAAAIFALVYVYVRYDAQTFYGALITPPLLVSFILIIGCATGDIKLKFPKNLFQTKLLTL